MVWLDAWRVRMLRLIPYQCVSALGGKGGRGRGGLGRAALVPAGPYDPGEQGDPLHAEAPAELECVKHASSRAHARRRCVTRIVIVSCASSPSNN